MEFKRYKQYVPYIVLSLLVVWLFSWLFSSWKVTLSKGVDTITLSGSTQSVLTGTLLISPYDSQGDIFDLLASTKYTLKMRFYQITDKETLQLLRNLAQLGVKIEMILENDIYGGGSKDFKKTQDSLRGKDVAIRTDEHLGTNYVHAKVMLIDDQRFMISTANLSYPSFWNNREYWFISSHTGVAQSLVTIFAKDRTGEAILSGDIDDHLLVCPINCRKTIENALSGAKESIAIQAQYIEDEAVVELLETQSNAIDVRLIVGEYQSKHRLDNLSTWSKIFDDLYLHAKNILIDDKILIMWSMNLSTNALDNNREFGIIIDDPRVIKQFKGQFERDWKSATLLDDFSSKK